MKNILKRIWLYFDVGISFIEYLFDGEKFKVIKSNCLAKIAYHYNFNENNYDKALHYYTKAMQVQSDNFYAHGGIATVYCRLKKYKEALDHIKKAISSKPKDNVSKLMLVAIYDCLGDKESYQTALDDAISALDSKLAVYDWLGQYYYELDMLTESEAYCKKALDEKPDAPNFYFNLALVHAAHKKYSEAIDASYKALQLTKDKKRKKKILRNIEYFKEVAVTSN